MFLGVKTNEKNRRAITFLENSIVFEELNRIIIFGNNPKEMTRLSQDFLTALNAKGFQTRYLHTNDLINDGSYKFERYKDLVVLDGLFENKNLSEEQKENLESFLSLHEGYYILITCQLNPDEVFSNDIREYFYNGSTWSRNFFGCKQLFMDDRDRNNFIEYIKQEPVGDYRLVQSLKFLSEEITPYNQLSFINKSKIRKLFQEGDDSQNNCLILTDESKPSVKLIPFSERDYYKIAVRLESFMAGNGYVGVELKDEEASKYYRLLIEGYLNFLKNGRESYMDSSLQFSKTDQDIVFEIKRVLQTI